MRIILFLSILYISPIVAQSNFELTVDKLLKEYQASSPGMAIMITQNDETLYKKCFGLANLEYDLPITTKTLFNATSLSKQFVAFGIYLLEEEGLISINDNINTYLPDFPRYNFPVTIYHLLSHTSGIRDQNGLLNISGYRNDDFVSNDIILRILKEQKKLNFEPGSQFEYSHSNYTLLAEIIELVTKQSLNDYMRETIFIPLKMEHTFFLDSTSEITNDCAYSYEKINNLFHKCNLSNQNYGPTNLMTTLDDLYKWTSSLNDKSLTSNELYNQFNSKSNLKDRRIALAADLGNETIIGCKGQFYRKYKGKSFLSHGGSLGGFKSFLGRFSDDDFSIIILGNDKAITPYSIALKIADIHFGFTQDSLDHKAENEPKENEIPTEDFSIYAGDYYSQELKSFINISYENKKLQLQLNQKIVSDMVFVRSNEFTAIINDTIEIEFIKSTINEMVGLKVSCKGINELYFRKIEIKN